MADPSAPLPTLTVNESFIYDFMDSPAPCLALGLIEASKESYGLIALRPGIALPNDVTSAGFSFGHQVRGSDNFEVIWFTFEFYGLPPYHTLINPNSPIARAVLSRMLDRGEYFFLAIDQDQKVTAFCAELGQDVIEGLREHWPRLEKSRTTTAQYKSARGQVILENGASHVYLNWVCPNKTEYLDLTSDRLELNPTG